ncbi:MAG: signal peptidase I [Haloferacaceae archaeon]
MPRLAAIAVFVVLAAAALGHAPVSVHYATSDSMEPTIGEGDVFLVTEGSVEVGDVALFHSTQREGLVAHRIVGETEAGYVTQGDANPSTDQAGGAPPVAPGKVVGPVVTVAGGPLTLSGVGPAARYVATNRGLVAGALAVVLVGLTTAKTRDSRDPRDGLTTASRFFRPFLAMGVAVMVTTIVVGAATAPAAVLHTDDPAVAAEQRLAIETGSAATVTVPVETDRLPMTYHVVEATGDLTVTDYELTQAGVDASVAVEARATRGTTTGQIRVYTYPAAVPRPLVTALHEVHPLAGALGAAATMLLPALALYGLVFDPRELLRDAPREAKLR